MTDEKWREFPIEAVLTVVSDAWLGVDMTPLLTWMVGAEPQPHQRNRAIAVSQAHLLTVYRRLAEPAAEAKRTTRDTLERDVARWRAAYGRTILVPKLYRGIAEAVRNWSVADAEAFGRAANLNDGG